MNMVLLIMNGRICCQLRLIFSPKSSICIRLHQLRKVFMFLTYLRKPKYKTFYLFCFSRGNLIRNCDFIMFSTIHHWQFYMFLLQNVLFMNVLLYTNISGIHSECLSLLFTNSVRQIEVNASIKYQYIWFLDILPCMFYWKKVRQFTQHPCVLKINSNLIL